MDRDASRVRKLDLHAQFSLVVMDHHPHPKSTPCSGPSTIHTSLYKKINRSHKHTHTPTENNTPDTDTHAHDKNTTPNLQMNTSHEHLTTLEDGAIYI